MNENILPTGTRGLMRVLDNTDGPDKTVDLYIASSTPIAIPSLTWSYSIDGVVSDTRAFNFAAITDWQYLGKIYVGYAATFILHLNDTGHVELGGPSDLTVKLQNDTKLVDILDNDVWKKAIPYVNFQGTWLVAKPYVYVGKNNVWMEVV